MADGRGGFSISEMGVGLRRGLFAGGLAVAVLLAGLPAGADAPEHGLDPTVSLTVTPDDALGDGQSVMVTGTGFPPHASGLIRECGGSVAVPDCDLTLSGGFLTDGNGNIPPSPMSVDRVISNFTSSYNCGVQACFLVADAGGKSSRHHISFAGAGTVPPSSTTTSSPTTTPPTTIGGGTTVPPQTTVPGATTVPAGSTPATTVPENLLCVIIRGLGQALPGLVGTLADALLRLLGCAPLAVS
jgi:hypothetical protein